MKPAESLVQALSLDSAEACLISLVGAGGKTTAMFQLAHELKALGEKVLVTTTTNIALPEPGQCDIQMLDGCTDPQHLSGIPAGTVVCLGGGLNNAGEICKVQSVEPAFIDELFVKRFFDFILVEADGSKRKPIKAPAEYEPVIPLRTMLVIGVIGLDALGKPVAEETVHRSSLFCSLTGSNAGDPIDRDCIVQLITAENGLFKSTPPDSRKVVLLNKADTAALCGQAKLIAQELAVLHVPVHGCVVASLQQGIFSMVLQAGGEENFCRDNS